MAHKTFGESEIPAVIRAKEYFRARILTGEYGPEQRLPSVREGAKEIGVHHQTVVEAYRRLAGDGLLSIRRGVGAFVKVNKVERQLFYCASVPTTMRRGTATAELVERITSHFTGPKIRADVRFVPDGVDHWHSFLEWLRSGAAQRSIAGVWLSFADSKKVAEANDALWQFSVPVVDLIPHGTPTTAYSVGNDFRTMVRESTRYLIEQGRRRLAMICQPLDHAPEIEEAFLATCQALDASCEICASSLFEGRTLADIERYGSRAVIELMSHNPRPDGLLFVDDFLGRGGLAALLRLGIRVPEDVRVCTLARKGDSYPEVFGLPVARMEFDLREFAETACHLMENLVAGNKITTPRIWLQPRLKPPEVGLESEATPHGGNSANILRGSST